MPLTQPPDAVNSLQTAFVVKCASQRIARIRGVHDHPACAQYFDDLMDQAQLRCLWVYFKILRHDLMAEADVFVANALMIWPTILPCSSAQCVARVPGNTTIMLTICDPGNNPPAGGRIAIGSFDSDRSLCDDLCGRSVSMRCGGTLPNLQLIKCDISNGLKYFYNTFTRGNCRWVAAWKQPGSG